jgi:F-type H+-transporting ATPase subunit delta
VAVAIANRYARALADVVGKTGDYRHVLGELEEFLALYRAVEELRDVLESPGIALDGKAAVLGAVLERMGASQETANFLRVLAGNYRLKMLEQVIEAYRRISNERLGIVEVRVASAEELPAAEQDALRERFEQVTRGQVEMEFERDEALLAGIRAKIRSIVYDGSVRGHLDRLRERLLAQ